MFDRVRALAAGHDRPRRFRLGRRARTSAATPRASRGSGFRLLCVDDAGAAQGYARYTVDKNGPTCARRARSRSSELAAATPAAEARLWALPAVARPRSPRSRRGDRPVDDVLPWLLVERPPRQADELLRHAVGAPARRRPPADDAVATPRRAASSIEVDDPLGLAGGRFAARRLARRGDVRRDDRVGRADDAGQGARRGVPRRRRGSTRSHAPGGSTSTRRRRRRAGALLAGAVAPWCNTWF